MSRTLFWYVFKDLLRIFLLACFSLAGIMSFGGLLRPLTDQGLDASQVGRILAYFLPAMMTYSLPIAAIFAATMVYGRLSADNELTACRAAGISYLSIATPALVLGLVVALISLLFLCFIVPVFSYKVEQVLYSNVAQLVANKIERQHQIRFEGANIFALSAQVPPQQDEDRQLVILKGPMIVTYVPVDKSKSELRIPREFYMAEQADVYITQHRDSNELTLEATLTNGTRFPRTFAGASQAAIETTSFGPYRAESPIHENTKFMDIFELKRLFQQPQRSKTINRAREQFVRAEQENAYLHSIQQTLAADAGTISLASQGEPRYTFTLTRTGHVVSELKGDELFLRSPAGAVERQLHFIQSGGGGFRLSADAREIHLRAQSDPDAHRIGLTAHLVDPLVFTETAPPAPTPDSPSSNPKSEIQNPKSLSTPRADFDRRFFVPMPPAIAQFERHGVDYYAAQSSNHGDTAKKFRKDLLRLRNGIQAEMHGRASFAVSCLILVMIGCCLGMMFRSGNFLSAFALSVIPAILTITLIITGQQVSENTSLPNALDLGLALIWAGNVTVLALAATLLWRLQRT